MRILQLISSAGYYGAENMLVTLAAELTAMGCHAAVGVLQAGEEPEVLLRARERGLATVGIRCSGRLDPGFPGRLNAYLKREHIDIVHTHGYKANLYTRWSTHASSQVATCHNWAVRTGSLGFYSVLDRLALGRVPAVVAVSENVAARLAEFDIVSPRVHVIPNGVDLCRFAHATPTLRQELNLGDQKIIGAVTRLTPGKGLDILISSFHRLAAQQPNCALVIVGAGELDAGLKAQASSLGIGNRIHFTGARADMPNVYASFDVFVLPSLDEGMPMCVLEAIAAGVPAVGTTVGAIPELLADGKGWLVPPGDPKTLHMSLGAALHQVDDAKRGAALAYQHVERHYSSAAMARAYLKLYQSVAGARPA